MGANNETRMETMKKWIIIEIVVLVAVLAAALAVCMDLLVPAAPAVSDQLDSTTQTDETSETTQSAPTWMQFPADRQLTAKQAFVYDCQTGSFSYLMGRENARVYPASVTKLFTAHVALRFLQPQDVIEAGDALELVGVGSSVAEIQKGDRLTVEQLVEAMLLPSGNDAACILAVAAGRILADDDSLSASRAMQKFMDEMNGQARALGMSGTHFTNPDGYHDSNHYTTYKDLVTIGKLAMENSTVMRYAVVPQEEMVLGGENKQWENTNKLIDPASRYYCPYATGLKTGQTPSAGSCLLSSFDVEGQRYIIGVFGCPEIEDRFEDTLQLLNETLEK